MMCGVELSNWMRSELPRSGVVRELGVFGIGTNDADYLTGKNINGKLVRCPAYIAWKNMFVRCYSEVELEKHPTYTGASVCKEWLSFMSFRSWWIENHIDGFDIDKDLLITGNLEYSPDKCVFVPNWLNKFTTDVRAARGKFPIGVDFHAGRFRSRCAHPKSKYKRAVYFDSANEAHAHWLSEKLRIAKELSVEINEVRDGLYDCVVKKILSLK